MASLTTLLFGVFKCRSMAEILFGLSEADAQLELQEKHYDKLKVDIFTVNVDQTDICYCVLAKSNAIDYFSPGLTLS